jgi:FMN reductase
LHAVENADLLLVGTPVYKGSYPGLFKHFVDLLDYKALAGLPVSLIATGGSDRHALVIEHQLRPLFGFFNAHTLPTGVFIRDSAISGGEVHDELISARLSQLVQEATVALTLRSTQSVRRVA